MSGLETYRRSRPHVTFEEAWRNPYERDADRILYSSAFGRLRDVTQVVVPGSYQMTHDRLYHSLKVAQVGRRLAQLLAHRAAEDGLTLPHPVDPDVVYAAGLAHDLGHPPFGHIGENELRAILRENTLDEVESDASSAVLRDSFEGNAQTLRLITRLSFRSPSQAQASGLNLTWATLAAVVKYPWLAGGHPSTRPDLADKWGAYDCDASFLAGAMTAVPAGWSRSIEASIMEWADDITYAVHDVEDFIRPNLIPIHELVRSKDDQREFLQYCSGRFERAGRVPQYDDSDLSNALKGVLAGGLSRAYRGGRADKQLMHAWASERIDYFSNNTSIDTVSGGLVVPAPVLLSNELMKQLVWFYVIDQASLSSQHRGQRNLIRDLYRAVYAWCDDVIDSGVDPRYPDSSLARSLPASLLDFVALCLTETKEHTDVYPDEAARLARAVTDYISSLAESQAVELYRRLVRADAEPATGGGRWHIT